MCVGGGSSYTPPPKARWLQDTSKEKIVSKYELSDENKKRNRTRRLAKVSKGRVSGMTDGGDGPNDVNDGLSASNGLGGYDTYSGADSQMGIGIESYSEQDEEDNQSYA